MKHEVDLGKLMEFQSEHKVIYASCSKPNKKMYCNLRGSYEIWHEGEKVLETMQPFTAVEKYNSI